MNRAALVVAVVAAFGCKKKSDAEERVLAQLEQYVQFMCNCHDKACADKVSDDMTRWATEMVKNAEDHKPDPGAAKKSAELMTRYTECLTKLMVADVDPHSGLPEMPKQPTIEALVRAARTAAKRHSKDLALGKLEAHYVRSDGTLDPTYGSLDVRFQPPVLDDAKRPLGAPVPESPHVDECPYWTAEKGAWRSYENPCEPAVALDGPRCSTDQIWARALHDEAPTAALATLTLERRLGDDAAHWTFSIVDEPRKVNIRKTYPDDCAPVVEHP